jgi:S-methylmethionine-dependent homocysteine/selenocysteine methylase
MAYLRNALPQLTGKLFLTDGGLETTLIFLDGVELPDFAAFHLLKSREGEQLLRRYYLSYAELAKKFKTGLILESATWRANPDWAFKLGYTRQELAEVNRKAIHLLDEIRKKYESPDMPVVISGCIGPRGDGYIPSLVMSVEEAIQYHTAQITAFCETNADLVTAMTLNYAEEAIGIAMASKELKMPAVISFTVETDGHLPTGQTLKDAIEQTDRATGFYPAYYMLNCAHPSHFESTLKPGESWMRRIGGIRANSSKKSHEELNESTELDIGNPEELGQHYARLTKLLPQFNIMGGCCGTDCRHVEQIALACSPLFETFTK